eukprot:1890017-Rhodomonas_salina.1
MPGARERTCFGVEEPHRQPDPTLVPLFPLAFRPAPFLLLAVGDLLPGPTVSERGTANLVAVHVGVPEVRELRRGFEDAEEQVDGLLLVGVRERVLVVPVDRDQHRFDLGLRTPLRRGLLLRVGARVLLGNAVSHFKEHERQQPEDAACLRLLALVHPDPVR